MLSTFSRKNRILATTQRLSPRYTPSVEALEDRNLLSVVFLENFDNPAPPDGRILYRADPVYNALPAPESGGNAAGNADQNGRIVRSFEDLILNDQSGSGFFLQCRTDGGFVNQTGLVWGTLTPVAVSPETTYHFSFYLTNENPFGSARIQPIINGTSIGSPVSASGTFLTSGWQRFTVDWNSGTATTADLGLFNPRPDFNANDFGIDTITLEGPSPDIAMQSAQLLNGQTVQYTYSVTGNPGPFQVGLYRSADQTFDSSDTLVNTQTITPDPNNAQAIGTFTLGDPTQNTAQPYLLVVADPENAVNETDETNNVAVVRLSDIVPTSLAWDVANGGADFTYQITGAAIPQDTTAAFYWATGTARDTEIGPATAPIVISAATPTNQSQSVHLAPGDFVGAPPRDAMYLLAVVDPDHLIAEGSAGEQNNEMPLPYDPKVTVTAKYDGDPSNGGMGRFFAGTNVLTDNDYTVKLSDSLEALRATVQVEVGQQLLDVTPLENMLGVFVTTAFDPGSLPVGETTLTGRALILGQDSSDFIALVLVEPLPAWVQALTPNISFDPSGDGPAGAGAYVFDGFLPGLSFGGGLFRIPQSVPLIGGKEVGARAGFELNIVAPLAVSSAPTMKVGLQADLTVGDSGSLSILALPPTIPGDNSDWSLSIIPGVTLDPTTLDSPNGFSLTIGFDSKAATLWDKTLYDTFAFVFPFGIPVELEFTVKAQLDLLVHAHVQLAFNSADGLSFLPAGTYLGVDFDGSLSATGQAGWFPPAWVQRLFNLQPGHFKVGTFALRDVAALDLSVEAEAHFGLSAGSIHYAGTVFTGNASFTDTLDLLFEIGDYTVFDIVIADLNKKGTFFSW